MALTFTDVETEITLYNLKRPVKESKKGKHNIKSRIQHIFLNEMFAITRYPSKNIRFLLADIFDYDVARPIQIWFQNKRQMIKKKRLINRTEVKKISCYRHMNCKDFLRCTNTMHCLENAHYSKEVLEQRCYQKIIDFLRKNLK